MSPSPLGLGLQLRQDAGLLSRWAPGKPWDWELASALPLGLKCGSGWEALA